MDKRRFKLLLPKLNTFGNLLWEQPVNEQEEALYHALYQQIRATGVWCSLFPEGDGFCFATNEEARINPALPTSDYYSSTVALFAQVFGEELYSNIAQFIS